MSRMFGHSLQRVAVLAAVVTTFVAVPGTAALADDPWHGAGDLVGHALWHDWRYIGQFDNSFLCNGAGTALILAGGAGERRCVERDGDHHLHVR